MWLVLENTDVERMFAKRQPHKWKRELLEKMSQLEFFFMLFIMTPPIFYLIVKITVDVETIDNFFWALKKNFAEKA